MDNVPFPLKKSNLILTAVIWPRNATYNRFEVVINFGEVRLKLGFELKHNTFFSFGPETYA